MRGFLVLGVLPPTPRKQRHHSGRTTTSLATAGTRLVDALFEDGRGTQKSIQQKLNVMCDESLIKQMLDF